MYFWSGGREERLKANSSEAEELAGCRDVSVRGANAIQRLFHVLCSCFVWGQKETAVGFPSGLPSSPASEIPWSALLAGVGRGGKAASLTSLGFVTTC